MRTVAGEPSLQPWHPGREAPADEYAFDTRQMRRRVGSARGSGGSTSSAGTCALHFHCVTARPSRIDASGRWRLIVTDDNANDIGTLNAWSLRILY